MKHEYKGNKGDDGVMWHTHRASQFLIQPDVVNSRSAETNNNSIQFSIVKTNDDILSLADLRYQEWMSDDSNPPKLSSFRLATAEIYEERSRDWSIVFLASKGDVTIGAAELSPIELQGVFIRGWDSSSKPSARNNNEEMMPLYVTDVVTSSAYRRLGIGSKLMHVVERTAWEMGSGVVFLHVEDGNVAARQFYLRLGYVDVEPTESQKEEDYVAKEGGMIYFLFDDEGSLTLQPTNEVKDTIAVDAERLATNAGTVGQLLMMKQLSTSTPKDGHDTIFTAQSATKSSTNDPFSGGGFGKRRAKKRQTKRKR